MKKAIFILSVLTLSIFTTACINNLAVQELNNKAMEYMKKGDYENAISRLKSSVDLDGTIFESQYNLAVAYTENEDYEEAALAFEKAEELNPKSPNLYYSKAIMYENYAKDLYAGNTKKQKELLEESKDESVDESDLEDSEYKPSESELEDVKKYYAESVDAYSKYMELSSDSESVSEVRNKISEITEKLQSLDSGVDTN